MAARSSQDLACCWRATARARWKYVSAFAPSVISKRPLRGVCRCKYLLSRYLNQFMMKGEVEANASNAFETAATESYALSN